MAGLEAMMLGKVVSGSLCGWCMRVHGGSTTEEMESRVAAAPGCQASFLPLPIF